MIPGAASIIELAAEFNMLRVAVPVSGLEPKGQNRFGEGDSPISLRGLRRIGTVPDGIVRRLLVAFVRFGTIKGSLRAAPPIPSSPRG